MVYLVVFEGDEIYYKTNMSRNRVEWDCLEASTVDFIIMSVTTFVIDSVFTKLIHIGNECSK